MKHPVLNVP